MEQIRTDKRRKRNWVLTGAAILFAALAIVVCLLLRPKIDSADHFVIRYGDGKTFEVRKDTSCTIVIRDGEIVDEATGNGEENVIRIENGEAWMEHANCPHRECMKQGRLSEKTVSERPLGTWIVCAPHRVYIELAEGMQ